MNPDVQYARLGDAHIAYQVVGSGELDLVYVGEFWHSIEAQWDEPRFEAFLRRLASFSRLICFDQRGTGLSDPVPLGQLPALEQWMDDVATVMESVGSKRAALLGSGGGGMISILFAASHPERTQGLVLVNSYARLSQAPDYPWGTSSEFEDRVVSDLRSAWGRGALADVIAPSAASDPEFRSWLGRYQRLGSSPGEVIAFRRMLEEVDVRQVLSSVRVPTLIIHRRDNRLVEVGHGRYLAQHIPGAQYIEVPGSDYLPFLGDAGLILDEIEEFLTGSRHRPEGDRVLATVLFTDIVGSTPQAAALGDRRWRALLEVHDTVVRRELTRFGGREIDTTGDGFLATFDGPGRAIRCARSIARAVRQLDLRVRAGVHTGEIEVIGPRIAGIAVHIAARVAALAGPDEVLVTSTVRDLVVGSGIDLEDRGTPALKGVPGEWRLFAVVDG
jgi:class 3 adenylate cyclase/pimeloyl-ACP methyl ester carboxylesterase